MRFILEKLASISGVETFVKEMWRLFPILLIVFLACVTVLGIVYFIVSVFRNKSRRERKLDLLVEHFGNVHTRLSILRRLLSGGLIGEIVFVVLILIFAIASSIWNASMIELLENYRGSFDSSTAAICVIELLLCVYFVVVLAVNWVLSVLSFDIKCFFRTISYMICLSYIGLLSFIYAMMWYFSTV